MAAIEPVDIVELGIGDAQAGLVLSTEAGWNQNEADWRYFLSKGIVFGMRDGARLVATAALLPYSAGNAWISMVLVTADFRRRGIATMLVDACLEVATRRGLTTWLDATPAGAAVYGPLGFTPTLQLRRLRLAKRQEAKATRQLSACQPRCAGRARCQHHGIRPQYIADGIRLRASGSRSCVRRRGDGPDPGWTRRAAYRSAAGRSRRSSAGIGRRHR